MRGYFPPPKMEVMMKKKMEMEAFVEIAAEG